VDGNGVMLMPTHAMDRAFLAPERDLDYVLDRRGALAVLLKTLPLPHQNAVHLFYFTDVPAIGVAARLGSTATHARKILADAEMVLRGLARTRFRHLCVNGGTG